MTRRDFLYTAPAAAGLLPARADASHPWRLWYRQPATRFLDALPVGNGRLAAMIFGGVQQERIELNESTVWSGAPNRSDLVPGARLHLDEIRQLLFAGKYGEANDLCQHYFTGHEDNFGTHLPMAALRIQTAHSAGTDYRRDLDIQDGIAHVDYLADGVKFHREVFASNPDNIIVVRLQAQSAGKLSIILSLSSGDLPGELDVAGSDTLVLSGNAWEKRHSDGKLGASFEVRAQVVAEGGTISRDNSSLRVDSANAITILISANSPARASKPYEQLRAAHIKDHQRLFNQVSIDLGGQHAANAPTNERLAALSSGTADPHLAALFFQYGRYLLIAGSRANSPLPLNLQGIWNDNRASKMVWTCDFHLDINTQQNYWHSEVCNLSECNEPLFRLTESLAASGQTTAHDLYGASGWVCHVYTNAWGFTAPGKGIEWGLFVTGGAWLLTHLWDHYRFTGDRNFLAQRAYPLMKGAAEFFLDYLVEDPGNGWLASGPSISPENQFLSPDGKRCSASMGPTCDRVLIYATFTACITAMEILDVDAALRARLETAIRRLPPLMIGKHGQLQEWLEDFDEAQPNHRHTTHLLALYPLDQITVDETPDLAKASRVTLERRLSQADWEDTEWSRANLINFFARLRDGESAHKHLLGLIQQDTDHNLMTFSRAGIAGAIENIFAIDGNTAGTAGMAEMLLQSHREIHLLPALPAAWPTGRVRGLRARGGFEVDLEWNSRLLTQASVRSERGGAHKIRYADKIISLSLPPGGSIRYDGVLKAT